MRVRVIVDDEGDIVGTLTETTTAEGGHSVTILPARPEHSLHLMEVPDEMASLSAEEFHRGLKVRLQGPS